MRQWGQVPFWAACPFAQYEQESIVRAVKTALNVEPVMLWLKKHVHEPEEITSIPSASIEGGRGVLCEGKG
jgi:hypothetical protein